MNVREWKRIAEKLVLHFRDDQAFMKGVEDAGGPKTERYDEAKRRVETVRGVCAYLKRYDPDKERFFRTYYGLDAPKKERRSIVAASMDLHVSESSLFGWRREVLSLVLIAAAQNGVFRPFALSEPKKPPV